MKKIVLLALLAFSLGGCYTPPEVYDYTECEHEFVDCTKTNCTQPTIKKYRCTLCGYEMSTYEEASFPHKLEYYEHYDYEKEATIINVKCSKCYNSTEFSISKDKDKQDAYYDGGKKLVSYVNIHHDSSVYKATEIVYFNDFNEKINEVIEYQKDSLMQDTYTLLESTYIYDDNHFLIEKDSTLTLFDSQDFGYSIKSVFEKVNDETTIENVFLKNNDSDFEFEYKKTYITSDDSKTITEKTSYFDFNDNWFDKRIYEIRFDDKGKLISSDLRESTRTMYGNPSYCYLYECEKCNFTYNENDKIISKEIIEYTFDNNISYKSKVVNDYDNDGNQIFETNFDWNEEIQQWEEKSKYCYELNANSVYEKILCFEKIVNNGKTEWILGSKIISKIDKETNLETRKDYVWSLELNDWVLYYEDAEQYDENGIEILYEYAQYFDPNGDKYGYRFLTEFDEEGNVVGKLIQSYSNEIDGWVDYLKHVYQKVNGFLETTLIYIWSDIDNEWKNYNKIYYGYDEDGVNDVVEYYYWSENDNTWIGTRKYKKDGEYSCYVWSFEDNSWVRETMEQTFEGNDGFETTIYYEWSNSANDWVYSMKFEYQPLDNGSVSIFYIWNKEENDWVETAKDIYQKLDGGLSLFESYNWSTKYNTWVGKTKSISSNNYGNTYYLYDEEYKWSFQKNDWEKAYKNIYSHTARGIEVLDFFIWDEENQEWRAEKKNIVQIDVITPDGGNLYIEEMYHWSDEDNTWIPESKQYNLNEEEPFRSTIINYEWSSKTNSWQPLEKFVYYSACEGYCDILTEYYVWSGETNSWILTEF